MNFRELLNKRATLIAEARKLVDLAETEKRELSQEERNKFDKMFNEADAINETIKREEQLREIERNSTAKTIETNKGESDESKEFRSFLQNAKNGETYEQRGLQNDPDTQGGYLHAAEQFYARLIKGIDNSLFVRQFATVLPVTSTDSLGIPVLTTDVSDAAWTTEVGAVSEDTAMRIGRRNLQPEILTKLIKVSDKLMKTSAIPVEQLVADRFAYKFGVAQENAFLNGDGSDQPLGIFEASDDGVPTAQDVATGNEATAVTAAGLINAKFALKAQYRADARWIFSSTAMKQISQLKDGEGQYLWRPGIELGTPDRLLGIPVDESEYAPSTFTTGLYVGALCNWKNYWIAELQGFDLQRLSELYAGTNQVGFLGRLYVDGAPVVGESFVRVKLA